MQQRFLCLTLLLLLLLPRGVAGQLIPTADELAFEPAPVSELDLPVEIDLKPFYRLADTKVDTLFTSAGYPNNWAYNGCDTRYKYSFRRGPLQFSLNGTRLDIAFTGYYRIVGSTRVCVNGSPVTPWTPPCTCGFDEAERRVQVSYSVQITLLKNYKVLMRVTRNEPRPLDRCTVCFWGQDITETVMQSLKAELDLSKAEMERNYGTIDLKPRFQQIWDQLNRPYQLNETGWLQIRPQAFRVNAFRSVNDQLRIHLGLSAQPVILLRPPATPSQAVPNISDRRAGQGFNIFMDGLLGYDSLSGLLSRQLQGRSFEFRKGPIRKKFVFESCRIRNAEQGRLHLEIRFSGTDKGYFYVTGTPAYNDSTRIFSIRELEFDIKSRDALLKMADWIFARRITAEISQKAQFDLSQYADSAKTAASAQLNRELLPGVRGLGQLDNISITAIQPGANYLLIRMNASGRFAIRVSGTAISL
ncbi:hypothetical protein GCM10027051_15150 [Niabella terrae]